jgi:hypothetical protein
LTLLKRSKEDAKITNYANEINKKMKALTTLINDANLIDYATRIAKKTQPQTKRNNNAHLIV